MALNILTLRIKVSAVSWCKERERGRKKKQKKKHHRVHEYECTHGILGARRKACWDGMGNSKSNSWTGPWRIYDTFLLCVLVTQSCPTLCDPMHCSPSGSSVHEIFQTRKLEWVSISFSRGSSQPRDRTWVSCTAGRFFINWATREAHIFTSAVQL